MVSKFFQRTVVTHIAFVGIGYLLLRLVWPCLLLAYDRPDLRSSPPPAGLVFLVTLAAAVYYSHRIRKFRPVPQNPIQQFRINMIIAAYAVVVALSVAIPLCAGFQYQNQVGAWPLPASIYLFFAWRYVYGVDSAIFRDIHDRPMSEWELAIFEKMKNQSRFGRSDLRWRY